MQQHFPLKIKEEATEAFHIVAEKLQLSVLTT
jgi:hypothetical protein